MSCVICSNNNQQHNLKNTYDKDNPYIDNVRIKCKPIEEYFKNNSFDKWLVKTQSKALSAFYNSEIRITK